MNTSFPAIVIDQIDGKHAARLSEINISDLPEQDVLVKVEFSSLNYKDGLAISGRGRIARKTPMVAGIDAAGVVVESKSADWSPGDRVIINGWGLSETEWGAYSRYMRAKPDWLIKLPDAFSAAQAMAIGTAGYTAALCVNVLEDWGGISQGDDEILVTGAAGGVGSIAISLLAAKGYLVAAATGREETHDYLRNLGASSFVRRELLAGELKSLQKERWSGAIDVVGSSTLANVLAQMKYGKAVAACGLAGGTDLPASVFPHILRSVALIGVDSVHAPRGKRLAAWDTLARHLNLDQLASMTEMHKMVDLPVLADRIVDGNIRGRVVIAID